MAEAARRMGYGHGSDVVRRLIARPIRTQSTRPAKTVGADALRPAQVAQADSSEPVETAADAAAIPGAERMRMELMLMKAVLQAERRENASLRACIGLDATDPRLGAEARAVHDRWAVLVDRLLHAPA